MNLKKWKVATILEALSGPLTLNLLFFFSTGPGGLLSDLPALAAINRSLAATEPNNRQTLRRSRPRAPQPIAGQSGPRQQTVYKNIAGVGDLRKVSYSNATPRKSPRLRLDRVKPWAEDSEVEEIRLVRGCFHDIGKCLVIRKSILNKNGLAHPREWETNEVTRCSFGAKNPRIPLTPLFIAILLAMVPCPTDSSRRWSPRSIDRGENNPLGSLLHCAVRRLRTIPSPADRTNKAPHCD